MQEPRDTRPTTWRRSTGTTRLPRRPSDRATSPRPQPRHRSRRVRRFAAGCCSPSSAFARTQRSPGSPSRTNAVRTAFVRTRNASGVLGNRSGTVSVGVVTRGRRSPPHSPSDVPASYRHGPSSVGRVDPGRKRRQHSAAAVAVPFSGVPSETRRVPSRRARRVAVRSSRRRRSRAVGCDGSARATGAAGRIRARSPRIHTSSYVTDRHPSETGVVPKPTRSTAVSRLLIPY